MKEGNDLAAVNIPQNTENPINHYDYSSGPNVIVNTLEHNPPQPIYDPIVARHSCNFE